MITYIYLRLPYCVHLCSTVSPGVCSALHQYYFVNKSLSWSEAQSHCRQYDGELATVHGPENQKSLVEVARKYKSHVWIGLYDDVKSWTWSLSENANHRGGEVEPWSWGWPWKDNRPLFHRDREGCALTRDGKWKIEDCNSDFFFICFNNNTNGEALVVSSSSSSSSSNSSSSSSSRIITTSHWRRPITLVLFSELTLFLFLNCRQYAQFNLLRCKEELVGCPVVLPGTLHRPAQHKELGGEWIGETNPYKIHMEVDWTSPEPSEYVVGWKQLLVQKLDGQQSARAACLDHE